MKNSIMWVLVLGSFLGLSQAVRAGMEGKECAPGQKMPAEFEQVKALVGTWKGKADMGQGPADVTNTFELTSGGTAILERITPGTPHEMVSLYCSEKGKVVMTHYCSLGNQPKMVLKKSTPSEMVFEMRGKEGVGSKKDAHMHTMTLSWKDKDHITETWTLYMDGKATPSHPFELARVRK